MNRGNNIKSRFESIGIYFPKNEITTAELLEKMKEKPQFDLEKITGIKSRRVRSFFENSFTIGCAAAERCIKNSKYKSSELDLIIFCSVTKLIKFTNYLFEPPMSLFIKNKLGAESAINFDISNACAGMMTGAYIVDNMIKAGIIKNGMVVSGEANTAIADTALKEIKHPLDRQFASLTVGDAGAAFILDRALNEEEGINFVDFVSFAKFADLCLAMPSNKTMGWAMYADAKKIHEAALSRIPFVIENVYKNHGLEFNPDNYDYIIGHQTSERAIHSFLETGKEYFSKDMPEPLFSLHEYGNTSSATHFVTLYKGLKENKVKKGSRILFIVAASGLGIGCLSAKIGNIKV